MKLESGLLDQMFRGQSFQFTPEKGAACLFEWTTHEFPSLYGGTMPSAWLLGQFLPLHGHVAFSHEPSKRIL